MCIYSHMSASLSIHSGDDYYDYYYYYWVECSGIFLFQWSAHTNMLRSHKIKNRSINVAGNFCSTVCTTYSTMTAFENHSKCTMPNEIPCIVFVFAHMDDTTVWMWIHSASAVSMRCQWDGIQPDKSSGSNFSDYDGTITIGKSSILTNNWRCGIGLIQSIESFSISCVKMQMHSRSPWTSLRFSNTLSGHLCLVLRNECNVVVANIWLRVQSFTKFMYFFFLHKLQNTKNRFSFSLAHFFNCACANKLNLKNDLMDHYIRSIITLFYYSVPLPLVFSFRFFLVVV